MRFWPSSSCSPSRPRPGLCGEARPSAAGCFGRGAWWRAGPCSRLPPPGRTFFHGGAWPRSGSTACARPVRDDVAGPVRGGRAGRATSGIRASRSGNTGASRRPLSAISTARTSGAASSMARCNWRQPPPARATMLAGMPFAPPRTAMPVPSTSRCRAPPPRQGDGTAKVFCRRQGVEKSGTGHSRPAGFGRLATKPPRHGHAGPGAFPGSIRRSGRRKRIAAGSRDRCRSAGRHACLMTRAKTSKGRARRPATHAHAAKHGRRSGSGCGSGSGQAWTCRPGYADGPAMGNLGQASGKKSPGTDRGFCVCAAPTACRRSAGAS